MITRSDKTNDVRPGEIDNRGEASSETEERYVSASWLARYWNVHVNTIYRDIRKGALKASRIPGGQFRVRWSDARRYGRPVE